MKTPQKYTQLYEHASDCRRVVEIGEIGVHPHHTRKDTSTLVQIQSRCTRGKEATKQHGHVGVRM